MNLTSPNTIRRLLKKHRTLPLKRLGQNFLINKLILLKVIRTANLRPREVILEIGPGIGNFTQELAKRVKKVITVEKDPKMVEILKETTKNLKNIKIIQADILKIPAKHLPATNYKIVANLPYYIVSPVIRKFLDYNPPTTSSRLRRAPTKNPPKEMILIVQKEIAKRIVVRPPDMNLLAVSVQFYSEPKIISFVSKKSFWPQPKVDSAIIKIIPRQFRVPISRQFREQFFRIVRAGFSQPRKQLLNNLSKMLKLDKGKVKFWLLKNEVQPNQRAETLTLEDWILLTKKFRFLP